MGTANIGINVHSVYSKTNRTATTTYLAIWKMSTMLMSSFGRGHYNHALKRCVRGGEGRGGEGRRGEEDLLV